MYILDYDFFQALLIIIHQHTGSLSKIVNIVCESVLQRHLLY